MKSYFVFGLLIVLIAILGEGVQTARADNFSTFQLNAVCTWGASLTSERCTGVETLTGTFTLNQTTGTVQSWDLHSEFSGLYYNSSGANYPWQMSINRQDTATAVTTASDFSISIDRSGAYFSHEYGPPIPCCTYRQAWDLSFLSIPGSPDTFPGGLLTINESASADLCGYGFSCLAEAHFSGTAVQVATFTPEPSSFLLLGAGAAAALTFRWKRIKSK